MEKEQNALVVMFILVIAICGGFILLRKSNLNLNFLKTKETETENKPVEKDYSPYKGKYIDFDEKNINLEIMNISEKKIDFSLTTVDGGENVTVIEKQITDTVEGQYNFTYKDSYNNNGKGTITLADDHILLSLDTDIDDTNLSHLGLGNFRNQKLYKEGTNVITYGALIGEYTLLDEDQKNITFNITGLNETNLRLSISIINKETNVTTNITTQLTDASDYKYKFTYHNETQTCKGTGIIEIKNTKLYLTLKSDETTIEKLLPELDSQELELTK